MSAGSWVLLLVFGGGAIVAAIYAGAMIYGVIHLLVKTLVDRWHYRRLHRD